MTATWPADKVERRSVESLIPYARNARTHSEAQVAQIAASIKEWGWTTPVLVDEDSGIIAGHGRVMAAQKLALKEVPVMVATGWSEAQKKAYVLADNQLALNAGWDNQILKIEIQELDEIGFDLKLTGFDIGELTDLFDLHDDVSDDQLPDQKELNQTFEVAVKCKNETDQETVFNLMVERGYKCRILTI